MADRNRRSRRRPSAKARSLQSKPTQGRPIQNQEAVDGILVRISETELTITDGQQSGKLQKRPGYEVKVAIPDWDKNRSLMESVRKGHAAQQKLLDRLQCEGARRSWMSQRFVEIDKAIAASLSTIAERIRTRRWRQSERADVLQDVQDAFRNLQRWTAKAIQYCERAEVYSDEADKETVLDAACLSILKVGELVNKVERIQHGFWEEFSASHFLTMRHMRNLIGHTDKIEGEATIPIGTGICRDLQVALRGTLFPDVAGVNECGFLISASLFRELKPSRPGESSTPDNSIAMIRIDDYNRLVICRVGRSEDDKLLISSSVTGRMKVSVQYLVSHPETESAGRPED